MTFEFPRRVLGELIVHQKGHPFKSKDYQGSGVPIVRVSNFTDDSIDISDLKFVSTEVALGSQKVKLKTDDVVIATVGSWPKNPASIVGKTICVPKEVDGALMNQNSVILRIKNRCEIDQKYLFIALKSKGFSEYLVSTAQGSANQASVTLSDIFSYELEWPSSEVRKEIVNIINSKNKKIRLNHQTNQTLEQMAQAIFKSWFVDFEPVKAKIAALEAGGSEDDALLAAMQAIAGSALFATDTADSDAQTQLARLQTEHPEQYATLRATAELFPSAMQESELGEIPEGWATKEIKALSTKISKGSTPRKADIQNAEDPETIELLKVRDLSDDGEITRVGLDKIPKSVHCGALKRSILETDDILFSIAGTIGRVAVIEKDLSNSNCNQAVAFIRLAEPFKYLELCRLNLVGSRAQNEVVSKVVQGVQANFSLASLGEISIVIPSDELLYDFNYMVIKLSKKRKELMTEVRVLAELRDALLPKLLSGELSLAAAEEQLADTVEPAHV